MVIHRDKKLSPVKDFIINVQTYCDSAVPEEIFQGGELIGWKIINL
jgi:hypothetical protein